MANPLHICNTLVGEQKINGANSMIDVASAEKAESAFTTIDAIHHV